MSLTLDRPLSDLVLTSVVGRSYDSTCFRVLCASEDRHFWFRARNLIIATLVRQITTGLVGDCRVLDGGCGTGNVLRVLEQTCPYGTVVGMDVLLEGLHYARRRSSCALVQGDIHMPPFGAKFDLIGLFDVLEHLPDDTQVLRDLNSILAPDGVLLLTVPAHASLWSYFDQECHHYRRYESNEVERKLVLSGYRVEYLTQLMASIFPIVWLRRRLTMLIHRHLARNRGRIHELAGELNVPPVINELLAFLLFHEARLIARRRQLPIGTSLLAIARKKQSSVNATEEQKSY